MPDTIYFNATRLQGTQISRNFAQKSCKTRRKKASIFVILNTSSNICFALNPVIGYYKKTTAKLNKLSTFFAFLKCRLL